MDKLTYAYVGDIVKLNKDDKGNLIVTGSVADDSLDLDKQVCDPDWLNKAVPEWFETGGNIREQHDPKRSVGKATEYAPEGTKHPIVAKVVDPVAITKAEEGLFTGFSVGIKGARVVKDAGAPGGRIVDGKIIEVSLVDRPANPNCQLVLAKAAGDDVVQVEEIVVEKAHAHDGGPPANITEHLKKSHDVSDDDMPQGTKARHALHDRLDHANKAATPDVEKKDYSTETRVQMAKDGEAIPVKDADGEIVNGRYPIADKGDLEDAVSSFGRAKDADKDQVKAFIKRRAKALDATDLIPDNWKTVEATANALAMCILDKGVESADALDAKFPVTAAAIRTVGEALVPTIEKGPDHQPAFDAARIAISTLIQQEAQEMIDEDCDETYCIYSLVYSLQNLMSFRYGEIAEGEMKPMGAEEEEDEPEDEGDTTVIVMSEKNEKSDVLGQLRSVVDEALKPLKDEIEQLRESTKAVSAVEERLAEVEKRATPDGPARVAPVNTVDKSALLKTARHYEQLAAGTADTTLRTGYLALAEEAREKAAA